MNEKKRKIYDPHYTRPNHFGILESMYNQGDFCDVTIQVGDQTYLAHKIILIAYIPYFRNMFSHDFLETKKDTIKISGVNPQSMKTVMRFAYTGKVSWEDVDDLSSLIKDADFLGLEDVKNECIEILKSKFDYNKAIDVYHLSTMLCNSSLKEWSKKIILKNFETISSSKEFSLLDFNIIKDILSEECSKFYINKIFKGVLRWIKHDLADRYSNLMELCLLIQIGIVDFNYILEIVNEAYYWSELLRECTSFKSDIELYYQKSKDNLAAGVNVRNSVSGIITFSEQKPKELMIYNTAALDKWEKIRSISELRRNFSIAVSNFQLFIIGGDLGLKNGELKFSTQGICSLNLKDLSNSWKRKSPLRTPRRFFGIISVFKYIFVCGGENEDRNVLKSVEKYDVETDVWSYARPMNVERCSFGVAAIDCYFYAIGGQNNKNETEKEVERYDLMSNQWETLNSRLNTARKDFGIAVLNRKIYVCGGIHINEEGGHKMLNSVEVYEPSTNKWRYVANMPQSRCRLFVVSHRGKLWAMGGTIWGSKYDPSTVIEYDPETDKWSRVETGIELTGKIVGCTF